MDSASSRLRTPQPRADDAHLRPGDCFQGMKRLRLNSGEVACLWDPPPGNEPPHDDCELGLRVGLADRRASFLASAHDHGLRNPTCATSPSGIDLSCSLFAPAANLCAASSGDPSISPSNLEMESRSRLLYCEGPDLTASPPVELNLGLTFMPTASAADSVLTSAFPASLDHANASDVLKPCHALSLPSFSDEGSPLLSHDSDLPMIDEGSTSNGCHILPFLKTAQVLKSPCAQTRRLEPSYPTLQLEQPTYNTLQDSAVDSDISMGLRAISGTTSTSGTSSGSMLVDRAPKMCRFTGCGKRARGASGLCISHGGGRRCQRSGCNKGAEGSTIFCKAHGGGRRCEYLGCTKSAEGKTDFCIAHGGGSRCLSDGCPKAARGRTGYCIRHGGGKRCQKEGCTKSAEGFSALCIAHGGGKRCQYPDCGKGAQGSTMFCKGHGGGKRCTVEGCNKGAEGSTSLCKGHGGGKRCMFDGGGICSKSVHGGTLYCVAHGGGKRCVVEGCTKSARGRTDCCVKHGGGKRCKFENCDKSAQGSTDFCKAHGGGKRCLWGQESLPGNRKSADMVDFFKGPCDKTAKGKLGLCAEHSALVQDDRVHGVGTFVGDLLSRDETRNKASPNFAASKLDGVRSWEPRSSAQFQEGNERLLEGVSGLQDSARHVYESQLFPQSHGLQASGSSAAHISVRSGMHTNFTKPTNDTHNPSWAPYFGVSSMHWQNIGRENAHGQEGTSPMEDDEVFNMSSLSLPEERVHGGNILALLSGGGGGGGNAA